MMKDGSIEPRPVTIGSHNVSVTAGSGTDQQNYTVEILGSCAPNGQVRLVRGDHKRCFIKITNVIRACNQDCADMLNFCIDEGVLRPGQCVRIRNSCLQQCSQQ